MVNLFNAKTLAIIAVILGAIASGVAWQNKKLAEVEVRPEQSRRAAVEKYDAERQEQLRKSQYAHSVNNFRIP